jgi:hypothetical protein
VAARFGVLVGLGVAEGRGVFVGVAVSVLVAVGGGVLVGVGWAVVAQARETKARMRAKATNGFRDLCCIHPPVDTFRHIINKIL